MIIYIQQKNVFKIPIIPNLKTRLLHIFDDHLDGLGDVTDTIFAVGRKKLLPLLDEAWRKGGRRTYNPSTESYQVDVNMDRVIGTKGEKRIRFIIEGENYVISAYPIN
jgi:hypothetical protein